MVTLGFLGDIFNLVISRPLGWILGFCYMLFKNYGLAILLFTIITRVLLFPLAIKQQKSSAQMLRIKPMMEKIQKKYAKDKDRLNVELTKLYQQEGYNPLSGCLPMFIQLPILMGLFGVVYNPLTYILNLSKEKIALITQHLTPNAIGLSQATYDAAKKANHLELLLSSHLDKLNNIDGLSHLTNINYDLLGLNLSVQPSLSHFSVYWLIPILSAVSAFVSSYFSMKLNAVAAPQAKGMNNTMLLFMPLFSGYIAFTVPSGIGVYWIFTNLIMIGQTYVLSKFYHPTKLVEKINEEKRLQREKLGIKIEEEDDEPEESKPVKQNAGNKPANPTSKRSVKKYNRERLSKSRLNDE